jgi:CRISPR/Cas system-associated protein Csx1
MSFVVDTNIVITLIDIGQVRALSKLKEVLIPQTVKNEIRDFDSQLRSDMRINVKIIDVSDGDTTRFVAELAKKLLSTGIRFVLELKDQASKVPLPTGWKQIPDVIIQNGANSLSNVYTNMENAKIIVKKTEQTRILGQADIHVCTLVHKNKKHYVLTMDTSIWSALHIISPESRDRVKPIFSCLKLMFKDDPKTFIEALMMTIVKKRYKFARNLFDNNASHICLEDLRKSVDDVLQRYLSDIVEKKLWDSQKDNIAELISLRERVRNIVKNNTHLDGELTFNEDEFINELRDVHTSLVTLEQQIIR